MKILLDTHVWLWWESDPERLSPKARSLIGDHENELYLSVASIWELTIKVKLGKLVLPEPPDAYVPSRMARSSLLSLDITPVHALRAGGLPEHHRDPFDRMIIAQSICERVPVLTADPRFRQYKTKILFA